MINQSPHLFNTTVANNVRIGNESMVTSRCGTCSNGRWLAEMIKKLPRGWRPRLTKRPPLLGGERHRLSGPDPAKDAPIILLDEPTVGLDPVTEQEVLDTFMTQLQGKTLNLDYSPPPGSLNGSGGLHEDGHLAMQGTGRIGSQFRTVPSPTGGRPGCEE